MPCVLLVLRCCIWSRNPVARLVFRSPGRSRTPPWLACLVKNIGFLSFGHWSDSPRLGDALGLRRAAPVDRPGRGGGGGGGRRRLLPGAPLRPPAGLAVPAARRRRCAHEPHRDRHRRDRHALREPALHGRGRRRRRPDLGRPAAARHQPGITGAGDRGLPLLRPRPGRGQRPRRDGAGGHPRLPRGAEGGGVRRAEPATDVRQPSRPAARRAALARACASASGGAPAPGPRRSGRPSRG